MISESEVVPYLSNYQGLFDGQYNLDIPEKTLQQELIKDLNRKAENPGSLIIKQPNGLLLGEDMAWDSQYFEFACHKLEHVFASDQTAQKNLLQIYLQQLAAKQVKYVFARVKSDNLNVQNVLTAHGFELMIHKAMLRISLKDWPNKEQKALPSIAIRYFEEKDQAFVLNVASRNLQTNRFTADPNINPEQVAGIYGNWAQNLINTAPASILIAEYGNKPAGMVALNKANTLYGPDKFTDYPMGFISLVAVDEPFRGKSIGQALIQQALHHFYQAGNQVVFANTALQNTSSLLMFQRAEFQVFSMVSEYRRWLTSN